MTNAFEERLDEHQAAPRRHLPVLPLALIVIGVAVLGLRLTVWRDDRPGGDDDRRVLRALANEVPRAMPAGARVVERRDFAAYWDACGGRPELGGWQPVRVLVTAELAAGAAMPDVARHLSDAGWSGPVFEGRWVRALPTGQEARLDVSGDAPLLTFVFTAQPPGPEPRGC